jgi:hypothetical protein
MSKKKRQTKRRGTSKRRKQTYSKRKVLYHGGNPVAFSVATYNVNEQDVTSFVKDVINGENGAPDVCAIIEYNKEKYLDAKNEYGNFIKGIQMESWTTTLKDGQKEMEMVHDKYNKNAMYRVGHTYNAIVWNKNKFTYYDDIPPKYAIDDEKIKDKTLCIGIRTSNYVFLKNNENNIIYCFIAIHASVPKVNTDNNKKPDKNEKLIKSIINESSKGISLDKNNLITPFIMGDFNMTSDNFKKLSLGTKLAVHTDSYNANTASNRLTRIVKTGTRNGKPTYKIFENKDDTLQKKEFEAVLDYIIYPSVLNTQYDVTYNLLKEFTEDLDHKMVKLTFSPSKTSAVIKPQKIKCDPV